MAKRLLYLEDLYDFYSKYKKSTHFSANGKEPIVVQVAGKVKFESDSNDTEGLRKVHLQACHTELNVNQSYIEESVMNASLPSFKNRPILGYIHSVNGQDEFYSHNMHEEDGEIVYDEVPVGIIPESCNAKLVYDEDKKKTYVEVDGYIFEEYSKAASILEREEECFVSVELAIRELSYNAKDKYLNIEDMYFSGVTILGKTPSGETVMPGMQGSNIKLADFSQSNNSLFADKLDSLTSKVDLLLSRFDIDNSEEGGNQSNMEKFNELLAKYNKTVEDIDFDYESMTDEELEAKFAELFSDGDGENEDTPSEDEESAIAPLAEEGEDPVEEEIAVDTNDEIKKKFTKEEAFNAVFEISFDEIHYALNALCSVYRNENEWCYVSQVYDDYFIMMDWDSDKYYKQSYTREGDNVTLSGERIEVFAMLLTESEKIAVDEMRSNYAALVEYKENVEKNELHTKREEILANEKYASISDNEDFKKLVKNMDNYSLEELEKEAKIIFADNIDIAKFEAKTGKPEVKVFGNNKAKKTGRYGNLFSK